MLLRTALLARRRVAVASASLAAGGLAVWLAAERVHAEEAAKPREKLAVGGVINEYKECPRSVRQLDPPLGGFFSKEMTIFGLALRSHACVTDSALCVAADRLSRMLRYLPAEVLGRLERKGASFHVIGIAQGTSDLPEHSHMKGVDGGYTGEKGITLDQRARGMGGVHSSCGEENLIDLDSDPRYRGREIPPHPTPVLLPRL